MSDTVWRIEFAPAAQKSIARLGAPARQRIIRFLEDRVAVSSAPERLAKKLEGPLSGLWRYRVGDYRIIVRIHKDRIVVVVLDVAHRSSVYR